MNPAFHTFHRVIATSGRIEFADAHRIIFSQQRELMRAIQGASEAVGNDDSVLNEVLNRAANAASSQLALAPQILPLVAPATANPTLAASTWTNFVSTLRHAVKVARETLPIAGRITAVAAVAALAMHLTVVYGPRLMQAVQDWSQERRQEPAPAGEVEDLMGEVTALRAELERYKKRDAEGDVEESLGLKIAKEEVKRLEAANRALLQSVADLEKEVATRKGQEEKMGKEVERLRGLVEGLEEEKERNEKRMEQLELSLEHLTGLFMSIAGNSNANVTAVNDAQSGGDDDESLARMSASIQSFESGRSGRSRSLGSSAPSVTSAVNVPVPDAAVAPDVAKPDAELAMSSMSSLSDSLDALVMTASASSAGAAAQADEIVSASILVMPEVRNVDYAVIPTADADAAAVLQVGREEESEKAESEEGDWEDISQVSRG
ncbi:hypothetical protein HDU97_000711 [Phlyctochytrium planicorne]|nr:hypothetical protein HDU97_000711 [Phlyctochytrium planicorne]